VLVIGLDSATNVAGLAIANEQEIIAEVHLNTNKNHSQRLMPTLDWLLKETGYELKDIDAYAVAYGPGSFTGLRIGLATVKALAHTQEKPVIGISTLDSLAHNLGGARGYICPILNARRNEVYSALYRGEGTSVERIGEYEAINPEILLEKLNQLDEYITFVGDGIAVYRDLIQAKLPKGILAQISNCNCRAAQVAMLGMKKLLEGNVSSPLDLEPVYLRQSEAEIKLNARLANEVK
jgi:tRNA threonylcarbamoyladenosine biosynthesis protein TsaB